MRTCCWRWAARSRPTCRRSSAGARSCSPPCCASSRICPTTPCCGWCVRSATETGENRLLSPPSPQPGESPVIELRHDALVFSFPELHGDARLEIDFQRTLRIPDDDSAYPLPPGLGRFPLRHV